MKVIDSILASLVYYVIGYGLTYNPPLSSECRLRGEKRVILRACRRDWGAREPRLAWRAFARLGTNVGVAPGRGSRALVNPSPPPVSPPLIPFSSTKLFACHHVASSWLSPFIGNDAFLVEQLGSANNRSVYTGILLFVCVRGGW